ncbi:MAG TPA: hypothetical protein VIW73_01715 [Candidatus Cybelea sp.]
MGKPTRRYFFRHLRDGRSLRQSPLTWLAVGSEAAFLSDALLVRAVHDRLSQLVDDIYRRLLLITKADRARRMREIFDRHILGTEHWSSLARELFMSRRQFFRERKQLCDELCSLLEAGSLAHPSAVFVQPSPADLVFNEASLAFRSGNPQSAERIAEELCSSLPPGELRSRALTLAADCALDGLRFDVALARCALAAGDADEIPDFETRVIASARVNVMTGCCFFKLSDYNRARLELDTGLQRLSQLTPASNWKRSELMQAILVRRAEIALHIGDFNGARENVQHLQYAVGRNGGPSEATFDLASIEASTQMVMGRLQCGLATVMEALSAAQRLGFNRRIVSFSLDRAWIEMLIDRKRGPVLAPQVAALADAVQVPELKLEAALFCAVNESPPDALTYASQARAMAPRDSMWAARAMIAQANACFKLGRLAEAWDAAAEAERLAARAENHRMRACALTPMARIRFKSGDAKAAMILKKDAAELLRLYGATWERSRVEQLKPAK